MICPVCNNQMTEGYIPASKMALMFVPLDGGKMPSTVYNTGTNTVPLTKVPFWKMQKAESYYCHACKLVITPVKELR